MAINVPARRCATHALYRYKRGKKGYRRKYNIAGPETNFFLSFVREENEKGTTNPDLMVVPQMVPEDNWVLSQADPDSNNIRSIKVQEDALLDPHRVYMMHQAQCL